MKAKILFLMLILGWSVLNVNSQNTTTITIPDWKLVTKTGELKTNFTDESCMVTHEKVDDDWRVKQVVLFPRNYNKRWYERTWVKVTAGIIVGGIATKIYLNNVKSKGGDGGPAPVPGNGSKGTGGNGP